ncbi:hypothetical protein RFN57_00295 [Streptomyces violaceochromogenes]|uniref:DUF397 domain-containing protein n=1 Tax=Streptomyces violaceochromogenes TaxID=67377 RepID=A0ABU6LMM6_9ACTN|nr:hypothetical protein [Streptomyces violaceochromogenes]MEC7050770.1 hypothetical protein [Streptomyces violaceochromogenes]GHC84663.1 hypothetical protein GCM10010309_62480 [Streptomyces violaceochromogenes]
MPDEYACGFDALARPLRMTGEPHQVTLELSGDEPAEADLRRLVAGHYQRFSGSCKGRRRPEDPLFQTSLQGCLSRARNANQFVR